MSVPFLLEIGTEEIPDWMIPGALDNLRTLFEETLSKAGVSAQSVRVDGTPRRLVLRAEGVPERQPDSEALVTGPGSFWSNRSDLYVGYFGSGNRLVVSNGALVADASGLLAVSSTSSNNEALVTGAVPA